MGQVGPAVGRAWVAVEREGRWALTEAGLSPAARGAVPRRTAAMPRSEPALLAGRRQESEQLAPA